MKKLMTILCAAVLSLSLATPAYAAQLTTTSSSLLGTQEFVNTYTDKQWEQYDKFCDNWIEKYPNADVPTITEYVNKTYSIPKAKKATATETAKDTKKTTTYLKVKKNMTLAQFKKTKTWKNWKPWGYRNKGKYRHYYSRDEYWDSKIYTNDFPPITSSLYWDVLKQYNKQLQYGVEVQSYKFKKVKGTWRYAGKSTLWVK